MTKIYVGADHAGFLLKEEIVKFLQENNFEYEDCGTYSQEACDYPVIAKDVVKKVLDNNARAILVCGSGQGMAMCANRYKNIRACVCFDTFSAHSSVEHNNSNILCLGERVTGKSLAIDICKVWLNSKFKFDRHERRVKMLDE